jgi:DNA-binding GntR family transcriptional regulator
MPTTNSPRNTLLTGVQPRYLQLAQTLYNEIKGGRYPVGALMPTEFELCEQFGVSRFTAREAVKRLVQLGMVVRQAGVGTRVRTQEANEGYRQNLAGMSDLYQYATDTTLTIDAQDTIEIDAPRAAILEACAGETWLKLSGRRHTAGEAGPLCVTEIWLHPAFRSIRGLSGPLERAVHAEIEQQFGEVVVTVEQEIRAVLLDRNAATATDVAPGSAGLWVSRRYRNRHGQLIELATSIHPAERFSYSTAFHREWAHDGLQKPGAKPGFPRDSGPSGPPRAPTNPPSAKSSDPSSPPAAPTDLHSQPSVAMRKPRTTR